MENIIFGSKLRSVDVNVERDGPEVVAEVVGVDEAMNKMLRW